MNDADRQKVNFVKGELESYYHLKDRTVQLNFKGDELLTRINRVGGGIAKIPSGDMEHNPHWRSPLFEELELIEKKIDTYCFRVMQVDEFLKKLQPNDREMVWNLHISRNDRKAYSNYCYEVGMERKTLHRYINRLILKHW